MKRLVATGGPDEKNAYEKRESRLSGYYGILFHTDKDCAPRTIKYVIGKTEEDKYQLFFIVFGLCLKDKDEVFSNIGELCDKYSEVYKFSSPKELFLWATTEED